MAEATMKGRMAVRVRPQAFAASCALRSASKLGASAALQLPRLFELFAGRFLLSTGVFEFASPQDELGHLDRSAVLSEACLDEVRIGERHGALQSFALGDGFAPALRRRRFKLVLLPHRRSILGRLSSRSTVGTGTP